MHDGPLYIDSNGRCALAQEIAPRGKNGKAKKWKCTAECKLLTPEEIKCILELKAMFQLSIPNIRRALDDVYGGCSYTHHSRPIITKEKEMIGASSNTSSDVVVNKDNEVANSNCNNDVTSEKMQAAALTIMWLLMKFRMSQSSQDTTSSLNTLFIAAPVSRPCIYGL